MLLKDIFDAIDNGKLMLPNFQREFVWERDSQKNLIASVLTKVPSPSTLVVDQAEKGPKFLCKTIGRINEAKKSDRPTIAYLLDGQQRYTTLFFAFKDQFGKGAEVDANTYDEIYPKLKNRWFLKLKDSNSSGSNIFIFNFDCLVLNSDQVENYLPEDILDFIEYQRDLKSENRFYSIKNDDNYQSLVKGCKKESCIPLQLFQTEYKYLIKGLLTQIGQNRFQDLLDTENRNYLITSLISVLDTKEKVCSLLQGFDEGNKKAIEEINDLGNTIVSKWADKLEDFLSTTIRQYDIKQVELKEISKAIATFEYINQGGTKLSTFDLLCAKAEDFDLRGEIISVTHESFNFFKRGTWEKTENYQLHEYFGLLKNDSTIESVYSDYLFQCLNLIHAFENNVELSTNVLKQRYALDNMNKEFLSTHYRSATKAILLACAILSEFCAHPNAQGITNKLAVIPMLAVLIRVDEPTPSLIKKLIAFYWIKLFSGNYDSHQNKNCIEDCKELDVWLFHDNDSVRDNLLTLLGNKVLNKEEFANFDMMSKPNKDIKNGYVNKSVERNIFYFILSRGKEVEDWHPKESRIINKESKINIHHIIPLAQTGSIGLSTKEYRNKNNHILDAVLNKTPISEEANKLISSFSLEKYHHELSSFAKDSHMITNDWIDFNYKGEDDNDTLLRLYQSRYELLLNTIRMELRDYLN